MNIEKKIVRSVTPPSKHVLWLHEKNGNTVIEEFLGNGWTELNITQEKIAEIESNLDSLDKEVVKTINGAAPVSGNINVDTLTPEQMRQVEAAMLLSSQVDRLNALLGLYTDRTSLTLSTSATGVQAGKAIVPAVAGSQYGKVAAYTGAYVSQEFSLTRGDLLLIKPGKTSNDVFTVSQVTTSSDGSKAYTKVMSLNALAEVPTDGYLRFLVMPADMTVCITFFASEAAFSSEVKVMRCGSFASICTQVGNIYADMEARLKQKADLSLVNNMIATFEESQFAYGVEWDITNSNPDVTRIGNLTLHASLPVQSLMRGCLLNDNGDVVKYLNPTDWTSETRDGSQGQVMVEIPEHYWKFVTDGNKRQVWLSTIPLSGYVKVPRQYVSAYEASLDRAGGKLASVVNMSTNYRGGGNNSSWDGTYRSLLGRPVTDVSLTNFRAYARKRKTGSTEWNCNTYLVQKTLYWLFVVEYATRNSQKAYNSALTTAGYRQGGLGMGVSQTPDWGGYNSYYPFVPCGHTDALGNQSGVVTYNALKDDGTLHYAAPVPRYRGVENPFAHIWKWTDGINVMVQSDANGGESRVYVATDPSKFSDATAPKDGYTHVGNEPRSNSYIKDVIFGTEGEIMALTNGAGESTYYCDYHYVTIPSSGTALRGILFGGIANYGADAGLVYSTSSDAPSNTYARIGSRLCFVPA